MDPAVVRNIDIGSPTGSIDGDDDEHLRARATSSAHTLLREIIAEEVRSEDIELVVPQRPRMRLTFSTQIDAEKFALWQKRSADRHMPSGYNLLALAQRVLASTNTSVIVDGQVVTEDGKPLTVQHPSILADLSVATAAEAIRALFANDGHVITAGNEVLIAAGFSGDALVDENPTPRR